MKHKDIFGNANWIKGETSAVSPVFRKVINISKIKKAEITIGVMGFLNYT